jgi:hypothetical protein
MAIGHAGEQAAHKAFEESAAGALVGLVVGGVLGWPRATQHPIGRTTLHTTTWHNALTHSAKFSTVVEVGVLVAGLLALVCAFAAAAIVRGRTSRG